MPFFVYILRCADDSYYVGHTDDIEKRLSEHWAGFCRGYTASHRPIAIEYVCEVPTRDEAIIRERQIKGWTRAKKTALIRGDFDVLHRLAKRRGGPSTSGSLRSPSAQGDRQWRKM